MFRCVKQDHIVTMMQVYVLTWLTIFLGTSITPSPFETKTKSEKDMMYMKYCFGILVHIALL